jgi:carboxyvinyl-carboxyphosphonate phosphorylmutase
LKAYEATGVDMLFVAGLKNRAQLDAVAAAIKKPLFLGSVPEDMMDLDYLSARNVRVCLQGHHQFWASVQGVHDTLKALHEGTKPSQLKNIASADLQKKVLRQADYAKWSKDFLNTK